MTEDTTTEEEKTAEATPEVAAEPATEATEEKAA